MSDEPSCFCRLEYPIVDKSDWHAADHEMVGFIEDFGHSVTIVAGDTAPAFGYTTGLWHNFRQPELAVFGLETGDMHAVLNDAAHLARDGWATDPGARSDALFEGLDALVGDVDQGWYEALFGRAVWFYLVPPLPFRQLKWPDASGSFIGQDLVLPGFAATQPQLDVSPSEHPPGEWKALYERLSGS